MRTVFRLKAEGLSDREISRLTSIPINTIRTWRNGRVPDYARASIPARAPTDVELDRFDRAAVASDIYAYLLGVYLGDGCLTPNGNSWSLRISLDQRYPGIIGACCHAIESITGRRPSPTPHPGGARCVVIQSTWAPWIVLFPQHGPGRKHLRRIELHEWQLKVVEDAPGLFLRGLIHTDGWRSVNRVHVKGKDYEYPRYQFSNRSDDIRRLFTDACDALGVQWRRWARYHISVARRESVALLDSFIGPKA
ncbi:MAG TPA: hypothetical protein VKR21_06845 [Solirubrobacteraceae bacterium]|nr:hypothetical protein [Solirubrobacteraceae bacterium]